MRVLGAQVLWHWSQRVVGLKARNPNLKVMLAIGGWSFGTAKFKEVAETRFVFRLSFSVTRLDDFSTLGRLLGIFRVTGTLTILGD